MLGGREDGLECAARSCLHRLRFQSHAVRNYLRLLQSMLPHTRINIACRAQWQAGGPLCRCSVRCWLGTATLPGRLSQWAFQVQFFPDASCARPGQGVSQSGGVRGWVESAAHALTCWWQFATGCLIQHFAFLSFLSHPSSPSCSWMPNLVFATCLLPCALLCPGCFASFCHAGMLQNCFRPTLRPYSLFLLSRQLLRHQALGVVVSLSVALPTATAAERHQTWSGEGAVQCSTARKTCGSEVQVPGLWLWPRCHRTAIHTAWAADWEFVLSRTSRIAQPLWGPAPELAADMRNAALGQASSGLSWKSWICTAWSNARSNKPSAQRSAPGACRQRQSASKPSGRDGPIDGVSLGFLAALAASATKPSAAHAAGGRGWF